MIDKKECNSIDFLNFLNGPIISRIKTEYNISNPEMVGKLGGRSSKNYLLKSGSDSYVLKESPIGYHQSVLQNFPFVDFCQSKNLPLSRPVFIRNMQVGFVLGEKEYTIFPYMEGAVLHKGNMGENELITVAHLLANFHQLSQFYGYQTTFNELDSYWDAAKVKGENLSNLVREAFIPAAKKKRVLDLLSLKYRILSTHDLATLGKSLGPTVYIHGDFHNENILFQQNKASYLLDIDAIRRGYIWEDVFQFIFLGCSNTGFKEENIEKAQFFLQAYLKYIPANEAEIQSSLDYILYKRACTFTLETTMVTHDVSCWEEILTREQRIIELLYTNPGKFLKDILSY